LGCSDDQPGVLVWHPRNSYKPNSMLVIDGNHRVTAMQELYKEVKEDEKGKYRFIKAMVMDPSITVDALEKLAQGKLDDVLKSLYS